MSLKPGRRRPRKAGPPPSHSARLYVQLAPERIALFRFLLEAHDNLALFSVADRRQGVLQLRFSPDQGREVRAFLERVRGETGVELVLDPGMG
ncbi:MAG TPA: DUF4911 domain-containing protein [Desulfovibrio sp.]|jgi:hypothetical protein|nr:DUF4911 domain-containing protein [Desulfovibrio sp.]